MTARTRRRAKQARRTRARRRNYARVRPAQPTVVTTVQLDEKRYDVAVFPAWATVGEATAYVKKRLGT